MSLPELTPQTPAPMGKGTLSRQLVLRTTALVALVTVALSVLTALASFQILQRQLDDQLKAAVGRPMLVPGAAVPDEHSADRGDLAASGLIRLDQKNDIWYLTSGPDALTDEAALELTKVSIERDPATIPVSGLGVYRFLLLDREEGATLVGLPLTEVTGPMNRLLGMAGLLTVGVILVSYVAARRVVERSLRPLTRLAATATHVSNLPLDSGEGQVPIRVAPEDARPESEVGRVGQAFNHMLDNVESAFAARHQSETKVRQFVADASHELRNPLASIRGYAELTGRGSEQLPPDAGHALNRIEAESDRMSALVQDLLLLARLDSEPTLDLQPTDLTEIVLNAVSDARAAGTEHTWTMALPEGVIVARADPHRLHQVVANLLANARTHTPPGTLVGTSLAVDGRWAVISVTDNGPGVPEQVRDTVFERFSRADASRVRRTGGSSTGLGLAIVAAVVNAHGGTVDLDSEPGRTTFTVRVPLA